MIGPASLRRVTSAHPRLLDAALATLVGGAGMVPLLFGRWPDGDRASGADAVAAVAAFLLLLARRRAPLPVLALTVLGEVAFTVLASQPSRTLKITVLLVIYTVARTVPRRTALIVTTGTALALYAVITYAMGSAYTPEAGAVFAWTGMFAAVGGTVRTWRDYVAAVEERALRAEASKEAEARRRVAEERLRIARELHDVIAHHIALITIQAGVAGHFLRDRPDQADVALGHIRDGGRTVLDELGSLLHVLRQSGDEPDETQPAEPVPGLARLGGLLESLTAAGLSVRHRQTGRPRPLPTAVDLAAYRVIQEGLTNAHKHGATAEADLLVGYGPDALRVRITNLLHTRPSPVPAAAGTGHGLTGMRERAHAVGGSFRAGAEPDGRFRLDVRLPLPEAAPPAGTDAADGSGTILYPTAADGRQG
ncbi:sensor histidine kinase [Streptomyces coeruleorubidus]|uniref:histidine kinase n=1 Tax=Streptomyces coeruleorubidus TaxID=116188 RepID=A0ABZ0KLY3_STRC4|nr:MULTISPECIES: histidine kinase [Streptomyces]WOT38910.1 histidine kinase [Streptomyces coeruleorubidus]GGU35696.1 two-component sensor histidine kinase [Streptomyces bellus]